MRELTAWMHCLLPEPWIVRRFDAVRRLRIDPHAARKKRDAVRVMVREPRDFRSATLLTTPRAVPLVATAAEFPDKFSWRGRLPIDPKQAKKEGHLSAPRKTTAS